MTTGAVCAGAASTALALAVVLSCWSTHGDSVHVALLSLHDHEAIAVSLLHALALVSAVTVAALVRHGDD